MFPPPCLKNKINSQPTHSISKKLRMRKKGEKERERERERERGERREREGGREIMREKEEGPRGRWIFSTASLHFVDLGFTQRLYSITLGGGFDQHTFV